MTHAHKKSAVALSSVLASAFLTLIKLIVGMLTGSLGILSEAAHSALDFLAALLTYFSVRAADKPADADHPYGHMKIESVSALIQTGLLFLTSGWIIYEAIQRLFFVRAPVVITWYAFVIIITSILVDVFRARALRRVAKETKSQALEADALHFSSDILSSIAVLIGLACVSMGYAAADSIAALVVAVIILHAGWQLGRRTIEVLIDTAPMALMHEVQHIVAQVPGVLGVSRLRVRQAGVATFVDMTIELARTLSATEVQHIVDTVEQQIRAMIPDCDSTIHTHLIALDTETLADRVQLIAARERKCIHDICAQNTENKLYLNMTLDISGNLTLREAHAEADALEQAILRDMPMPLEITIHIEPLDPPLMAGVPLPATARARLDAAVRDIAVHMPVLHDIQHVHAQAVEGRWQVTLRCRLDGATLLTDAHRAATQLECKLREKCPEIEGVVVHTEPL